MLHTGLVAPWHMESSRTRDQTRVSCIARRILYHWAAREAWKAESWPLDLQGSPCMSSFILWHWLWATPCPVHCRTLLGGAWARIYFSVAFPSLSLFFFFFFPALKQKCLENICKSVWVLKKQQGLTTPWATSIHPGPWPMLVAFAEFTQAPAPDHQLIECGSFWKQHLFLSCVTYWGRRACVRALTVREVMPASLLALVAVLKELPWWLRLKRRHAGRNASEQTNPVTETLGTQRDLNLGLQEDDTSIDEEDWTHPLERFTYDFSVLFIQTVNQTLFYESR